MMFTAATTYTAANGSLVLKVPAQSLKYLPEVETGQPRLAHVCCVRRLSEHLRDCLKAPNSLRSAEDHVVRPKQDCD